MSVSLFIKICKQFNEQKVTYAVVGGWALALHKIPRATFDLDFVLQLKLEQFVQVEKILNQLGLYSQLPVNAEKVFHFREEYIQEKNLIVWNFSSPKNPSEIVDIILTENASEIEIQYKQLATHQIPVASPRALIQMKQKAGRPQDLEDIKWLKTLIS